MQEEFLNSWLRFSKIILIRQFLPWRTNIGYVCFQHDFAGQASWLRFSLISVITHAVKSIFSHSARPLMWLSRLGLMLSVFSVGGTIVMALTWIFGTVPFARFATIVGFIDLGFSLAMLRIGVLAQYLAYDEVKQKPIYIVAEKTI